MRYDRQLLLLGAKRNAELTLDEVHRYGLDSYGDRDYVRIYGLAPDEWFARGVRLLGRTAVECTRDALADAIGRDIAAIAASAPSAAGTLVLDPFAGSGNTLYWILRHLPGARGIGFEVDAEVFARTRRIFAALGLAAVVRDADYRAALATLPAPRRGSLVVAFVAPPWGTALHPDLGLDLRHTTPPIAEIVADLAAWGKATPLLVAIQVFEKVVPASIEALRTQLSWLSQRTYSLNAPGANHGLLIGTIGWVPA